MREMVSTSWLNYGLLPRSSSSSAIDEKKGGSATWESTEPSQEKEEDFERRDWPNVRIRW